VKRINGRGCIFSKSAEVILKKNIRFFIRKIFTLLIKVKVKIKQSHYRPGQALRVPGG
jgi:hypothetical protein